MVKCLHGQTADVLKAVQVVVDGGEGPSLEQGVRHLGGKVVGRHGDDVAEVTHPGSVVSATGRPAAAGSGLDRRAVRRFGVEPARGRAAGSATAGRTRVARVTVKNKAPKMLSIPWEHSVRSAPYSDPY